MPVDVAQLGAHVEAHAKLQPVTNTLLLGNGSDHGDNVYMTELPIELMKEVETLLMHGARHHAPEKCEADYECFGFRCEAASHYTTEEFRKECERHLTERQPWALPACRHR